MLKEASRLSGQPMRSLRAMGPRHTTQRQSLLLHSKPAVAVAASTAPGQAVPHGAQFRLEVPRALLQPKVHRAKLRPQVLLARAHLRARQVHQARQARPHHPVRQALPPRPAHRVPHRAV
jgi:hypothetical protein